MDYTTLSATLLAYTENSFPETPGSGGLTSTQQVDTFIQQAEQRIYNSVQLLELRKNVTGNVTTDNKYLAVPTDWLANYSIAVIDNDGAYSYLLNKDVNFIREAFPYPAVTGIPTHYAMFDDTSYILGPTPDDDYGVELHYFFYPESIVTAGTTWLGDNFDSVLLYGSLLEAYTFMKGEGDVMSMYQQRYNDAMDLLRTLGEGRNRQDVFRTLQARLPVS